MSTDYPNEPYANEPPIGGFHRPPQEESLRATDFWAVWCPQERVFVESIWWYEFQAHRDAEIHNARHDPRHNAFPYHVVFQEPGGAAAS